MAELDGPGAVEFGGLVQGLIDVRQGRQVQDHVVGQALPQGDDHGAEEDQPLIRQEWNRVEAPRRQQVIDGAALVEKVAPGQGDDDQRGDGRQVVEGAEEADAGHVRLDEEGQQQRQEHHEWDDAHRVDEGVRQRLPELGV